MKRNKLQLNEDKTEYMITIKPSLLSICAKPPICIDGSEIFPTAQVKNLGVIFDEELTLSAQVTSLCQ